MFFPIRSDRPLRSTPWVNYSLITANVGIFAFLPQTARHNWVLLPADPQLYQFITYQFLHAGWDHIIGNMVFLFVFGNSVEDRLGKLAYLAFYLGGGVIAGLGHFVFSASPVVGASGSVSAVTGAFLAMFPLTNITIVYWFYVVGAFEVSSIVLILFQIGKDIIMQFVGRSGVAYMAHLAGYLYGFFIGMGLLWTRLMPREHYDLLAMIERRRRRAQFQNLTRRGFDPWKHEPTESPRPVTESSAPSTDEPRLRQLRHEISRLIQEHGLGEAARLYDELLQLDGSQVLGQQHQLDIANQLMSEGRYDTAACAYELFLNTFKHYGQREQVELILGLIYVRYLQRRQRGRELLASALTKLRDDNQRELAQEMLAEL